jgi:hypothetical protein
LIVCVFSAAFAYHRKYYRKRPIESDEDNDGADMTMEDNDNSNSNDVMDDTKEARFLNSGCILGRAGQASTFIPADIPLQQPHVLSTYVFSQTLFYCDDRLLL